MKFDHLENGVGDVLINDRYVVLLGVVNIPGGLQEKLESMLICVLEGHKS